MVKSEKYSVTVVDDDNMMREILKYILRNEDNPVSAMHPMDKSDAIEKGANGFVVKPFNPASGLDKIAMGLK